MPQPALTRYDFEQIATALADCKAATLAIVLEAPTRREAAEKVGQCHAAAVRSISAVLARSNGRFDPSRFESQANGDSAPERG